MPELICILNKDDIAKKVASAGDMISHDYKGTELVLVGVLKGAFVFLSDLIRNINIPVQITFIGASSYGSESSSSGKVRFTKELDIDIKNKHVLIVEDIVDTGLTTISIANYLKSLNPISVKICSMIDKKERRQVDLKIDYACHVVKDGFLVGYGLDFNQNYRELPGIYVIPE